MLGMGAAHPTDRELDLRGCGIAVDVVFADKDTGSDEDAEAGAEALSRVPEGLVWWYSAVSSGHW
jgi:hypothetical protein